jgi:hypothetical protein
MDYKSLWLARKDLVGYYEASKLEKDFLSLVTKKVLLEVKELELVDLGCGDGRLSASTDLSLFSKVILCDEDSVVYEAGNRLQKLKGASQILCVKDVVNNIITNISNNSLVLCCGLVSLMPEEDHLPLINNILIYRPAGLILAVPRYNIFGNFYIKANFLRGKIANKIIKNIINIFNFRKNYSSLFLIEKYIFTICFSFFEIFVPHKITRLSRREYIEIFLANDYELIDVAESGFSSMFGFRRKSEI